MNKKFLMYSSDGVKVVKEKQLKHFLYYKNTLHELPSGITAERYSNCLFFMKYHSNSHPVIKVSVKRNNNYIKRNVFIGGYEELFNYMLKHKEETMLFVGFNRAIIGRIFAKFSENL